MVLPGFGILLKKLPKLWQRRVHFNLKGIVIHKTTVAGTYANVFKKQIVCCRYNLLFITKPKGPLDQGATRPRGHKARRLLDQGATRPGATRPGGYYSRPRSH